MDEYLDSCAAQVENYTANEANKVYALVLIALFERQFRLWAGPIQADIPGLNARHGPFLRVFDEATAAADVTLDPPGLRRTIEEAFEVGNVVRHGEGRALARIQVIAPRLIDRSASAYVDLLASDSPDSEWLVLARVDIERYAGATIQYWGLADKLPGAASAINFGLPAE